MSNIKPISDLRNYAAILDKQKALNQLLLKLQDAEKSVAAEGTISADDLEAELDEGFFRIHRSYIVNLRFVRKTARTEVVLKDGTVLPLSRKLYEGLNQALIRYF